MAKFNKHQGESLAFKRGLQIDGVDENLATDWTCRLVVKSFPHIPSILVKLVTSSK